MGGTPKDRGGFIITNSFVGIEMEEEGVKEGI
jgi:hypothetical protein